MRQQVFKTVLDQAYIPSLPIPPRRPSLSFILMTPQLYINYRLKSVSHLPWRFLCFRCVSFALLPSLSPLLHPPCRPFISPPVSQITEAISMLGSIPHLSLLPSSLPRFVNTFIDDLFAFIIKMPTMHRISCFRDDVVFLIYLYQRWMYPVDKSRQIDAEDCAGSG